MKSNDPRKNDPNKTPIKYTATNNPSFPPKFKPMKYNAKNFPDWIEIYLRETYKMTKLSLYRS